jgi:hypothetical protein
MEDQLLQNINEMFYDQALAKDFYQNGYLILPDFLEAKKLEDLRSLYGQHLPGLNMHERGIYSNLEENPKTINKNIEATIYQAFDRSLNTIFKNYKIYGGSFLIKGYGTNTQTELHQDWSAVDESRFPAFSVWTPLQDVDEKSGCLTVVSGSNHWVKTVRGINFPSVYVPMEGEAAEYVIDLPIKAGTAVVFAMNVFHGSRLNLQNSPRPAMHLALTHKEAQLIHYLHQSPSEKFAVIDCNEDVLYDFIFDMKNGVIPAHAEVLDYIWDAKKLRITESEWLALAANQLNKN